MADRPARKEKPTTAEALRASFGDISLPAIEAHISVLRQYVEMALSEDVRVRRVGEKLLREAATKLAQWEWRNARSKGRSGRPPAKLRTTPQVSDKTVKRDANPKKRKAEI